MHIATRSRPAVGEREAAIEWSTIGSGRHGMRVGLGVDGECGSGKKFG